MEVLVYNCFNWIGFHYVNFLLHKGMVVKGVDKVDSDKKENFYMFVGRNSSFELIDSLNNNECNLAIVIGEHFPTDKQDFNRVVKICNEPQGDDNNNSCVMVNAPLLFGEWMDMSEEGILWKNRMISFSSQEFLVNAVYIEDFIKATYPLLDGTLTSEQIMVYSKKKTQGEAQKLENSISIRDNIPIEQNVRKVLEHYQRYKDFY
jgi:hypothetical protein